MYTIVRILKMLRLHRLAHFVKTGCREAARRTGILGIYLGIYLYFYHHYYKKNFMKLRIEYRGYRILRPSEGNDLIAQLLESAEPAAIAKFGSVETQAIRWFFERRRIGIEWDLTAKLFLYRNAGVFPPDDEVLDKWCLEFTDSIKSLDLIGVEYSPNESWTVRRFAPNARLSDVAGLLDWFQHKNPWTRCLKDKRVLVIHPFEQTIRRQFLCRDKIWQDERCLPYFELDTIRVPLSDALVKSGFKDWFDALEHMKTEIAEKEFDVAIVGAGAYSIPLVACVKKKGKSGIHLGGQTQTLFGIRGRRWDNAYSGFYNSYWCRPSKEETPENVSIIEDGCYW